MKKIYSLAIATLTFSVSYAQERPNVLLILTDDQGWGDAGIHGNNLIHTPTLDRLYSESAVLNYFYISPLCAPSRASLLTGRDHLRTGVSFVQNGLENMRPEETTIAELFKKAGYATGCFGKWHNGAYYPYTPNGQGFDEFLGFCSGHWANYFDPILQHNETMVEKKGYISNIFTDAALNFIDENKGQPFFCYLPFNAPHSPYQVPDKYFDKYYNNLPIKDDLERAVVATVYGMVENVDDNIARIFNKLDELKLRNNTIVLFMSDNGPTFKNLSPRYNGGMRGEKGTVHEGGVRVPCFVNWQGRIKHRIIDTPTAVIDILPTLMNLCGFENFKTHFPIDGISLDKLILGKEQELPERNIYTHRLTGKLNPALGAVRTNSLRLEVEKDSILLFDLLKDPEEKHNIYDKNNSNDVALYEKYKDWFKVASEGVLTHTIVPVGYKESPSVRIAAPEALLFGQLKFIGAPNANWVNYFQSKNDSIVVEINVVKSESYHVSIEYTNSDKDSKSRFFALCNGSKIDTKIPYFKTTMLPNHDRVDRAPAAYPQTWAKLPIGKFQLRKGKHRLTMYAENAKSKEDIQVKTIIISQQ